MGKKYRLFAAALTVFATVALAGSPAFAAYLNNNNNVDDDGSHIVGTPVSEIKEMSGLIASKKYPNWYYAISDVWKTTDSFSACQGLSGTSLTYCIKVQRAKVWALYINPTSHYVTQAKSFTISNQDWAQDRFVALNGDWEDITNGPDRVINGTTYQTLLIAATGDSANNKETPSGSCDSRRFIQLVEPNPATDTTWAPTTVYDLNATTIQTYDHNCNTEAAFLGSETGPSYVYMVSKGANYTVTNADGSTTIKQQPSSIFKRVLTPSTGRSVVNGTISSTPVPANTTDFSYVGPVLNADPNNTDTTGIYTISGAGYDPVNDDLILIDNHSDPYSPDPTSKCNLLRWHHRGDIATMHPAQIYAPGCDTSTVAGTTINASDVAEGVAFFRSSQNCVRDLDVVYDMNNDPGFYHAYLPWQGTTACAP